MAFEKQVAPAPQAAATTTTTKSVKAPTAKQYIIAALMAVLVAAIIVTVFFIVLSPARILISVADASSHKTADGVELALTLSVNNTSTRARVEYDNIYIDVSNSTVAGGLSFRADISAAVAGPLLQPKLKETRINATLFSALKGEPLMVRAFTRNMTNNAFAVTVTAVARFKVGFAQTRLYDIKVTCAPVSFFPAAAELSGVPPAPLPVLCG
ncbi:hypothetical protein SETIT_4G013200v2 [Setaria italica]|uniref:Late embryogenesis abundant protein LEA-2 subgroup domain-containing protein n=1 Tax=Setaria italica TaxID=4555 RepID=A0A368QRK6_SETIT|nr:hypothetical protein SETIT_4G013200v2 [Setaria italica]